MAAITLDNVSKLFGGVTAVERVNLRIEDGEFFALLGPSGCGKTTTLRMIAGLEQPSSGVIRIGERDVTDLPPRERDVAMVFQDYALYPHMTLLDNIGYPLKVHGVGRQELVNRVREASRNLNIDHLLDRRPGQLSGGQQQRAAVARAVVHHAQVFLFDEPLSNLDAKLRVEARGFLRHLQQQLGMTTVYVTHDQAEAMALADKIAIMESGRVLQIGAPLDVYRRPQTVFVASFLGNPPMNLLPCRLDLTSRRVHLGSATLDLTDTPQWQNLTTQLKDGEEAILGVRPEHLAICAGQEPQTIPGELYAIQPLGAESLVILQVGDTTISVRIFGDEPPRLSNQVWVRPDLDKMFFYRPGGELIA